MPKASKIQIAHLLGTSNDLFIVDDKGRLWRRPVNSPDWQQDGELPSEPAVVEIRHDQLQIDAPAGLDEEKPDK